MPGIVVTATSDEQVSTAQLKTHLRVLHDDDDTYIGLLGTAAREYIEEYTHQAMVPKAITWFLEDFPAGSQILHLKDHNPLQSVSEITYLDTDGTEVTMSTEDFNIDTDSRIGKVLTGQSTSWPGDVYDYPGNNNVEIDLGVGHTTASCPESFRHAEKLLVKHWYMERSPVSVGHIARDIPLTVNALLDPHVINRFGP